MGIQWTVHTSCYWLVLGTFENFHSSLVLVYWVQNWYLATVKQEHTWYWDSYKNWYKVGITSSPYEVGECIRLVLPQLIPDSLVGSSLPVLIVEKSFGFLLPGFGYLKKKLFHSSLVLCIESKTDFGSCVKQDDDTWCCDSYKIGTRLVLPQVLIIMLVYIKRWYFVQLIPHW
jgi:hypothetical protein